jgi:phosphomannomutase
MAGIFKAYDIRGIVEQALTPEIAYLIGRGLAEEVFPPRTSSEGPVVVSRDMRTHSPELAQALVRGLREGGCDVLDIGLAATPMNYWANMHYGARGSVTVTASHNGPQYNGFKVSGPGATPMDHASGLSHVEHYVARGLKLQQDPPAAARVGECTVVEDALSKYLDWMDGFVQFGSGERSLKIGVDAANGMGGFFLGEFFARHAEIEAVPLFWELDGTFPNHEADPLKAENLVPAQELVRAHNCDIGVSFDGDADRCMFIDENGDTISSDLITALIAGDMLERHPGKSILYDLRSSHVVPEWIKEHGGVPVRGRVGHSFMKRLLKEREAPFGGELSGHYYFAECFYTDSGLMAMIQVINICRKSGQTLSQLIAPLRRYCATGEINFYVADAPSVLREIEAHYRAQGATIDHLDGLTVEMPGWWFNLRSSNTEPLLRLNLEASDEAERDAHLAEVTGLIGAPAVTGH